jgi:high-affinity nickel-transport protein
MPPTDMLGLITLVFLLGLKHGLDPDHLVAIDGLARSSARVRPWVSRWSGLFFSLGHGVVVTLVGLIVAMTAADWQVPQWVEHLGASISIGVLFILGVANILVVVRAAPGKTVAPVGIRSRWLTDRVAGASHPVVMASVGAAFALSFDTLSHALLFSLTGATMAGALFAALLGLVFTLGMVLTDALNGLWVARLISGADRRAAIASRLMSGAISLLCLVLAVAGLAKYALPTVTEHAAFFAPAASVGVIVTLALCYVLAHRLAVSVREC